MSSASQRHPVVHFCDMSGSSHWLGLPRALAEEWDYVAPFYVITDAVASENWARLQSKIAPVLDERPGHVLGGVSTPTVPGLAIKLLTRTAPDLTWRSCVKNCGTSRRYVWESTDLWNHGS